MIDKPPIREIIEMCDFIELLIDTWRPPEGLIYPQGASKIRQWLRAYKLKGGL
jgi:hypothetical protein